MRIVHIIAALPRASGMSEAVAHLALAQRSAGHDVQLVTVGQPESDAAQKAVEAGVRMSACPPSWPQAFYYSRTLKQSIGAWVSEAQVVHVHGCWTFPVWWGCRAAAKAGRPLVRSPHGCLEPERLRISRWKKRAALALFERRFLRRASTVLATCAAEREGIEDVLKFGSSKVLKRGKASGALCEPKIEVIPLGVDPLVFEARADRLALAQRWPACAGKQVALFLSRLHPLKGADLLLDAWASARSARADSWHLLIAGPDEQGTQAALQGQVQRLGLERDVTFCGPLYGADRASVMASADLFILPTRNENFGIVVAEALACGVPVITTKGAPWAELLGGSARSEVLKCASSRVKEGEGSDARTSERSNFRTSPGRCGWWVEVGAEPLAQSLSEAMGLTVEERRRFGENGRRLAEAKYGWKQVSAQVEAVYESCLIRERLAR